MNLSFTHVYHPPSAPGSPTLVMLHGTGGNEHDLVPMAAELLPGAAVLSPRGKVLEGTNLRFFRRLAEGVFDLDDDGIAVVLDPAAQDDDKIVLAGQGCPTQAIAIFRDGEKIV